jgi:hypothetical protein
VSVAFFFEMPQVTADTAAQFSAHVREHLGSSQPDGGIFHAEGPDSSGGWWSFNVWESDDHFTRFLEQFVVPAMAHVGLTPPSYRRLDIAWDTSQMSST